MPSSTPFHKEEIAGKTVIDTTGKVVGKVSDITFTLDSTITLWVQKDDGTTAQIPLGKVMGVSDHVIVREENVTMPTAVAAAAAPLKPGMVRCKACGADAPVGTAWCPNCGRAIG